MDPLDGFWVRWPASACVGAAYEVRLGPFGVETVLYTRSGTADGETLSGLRKALENMLAGLPSSGERRGRTTLIDDQVTCVHARIVSTGRVIIEWGNDPRGDDPGRRAKAFALIAFGVADLEARRRGSG